MRQTILYNIARILFVLGFAPLNSGVLSCLKEIVQNKRGPRFFPPYRDFWKLFCKDQTVSSETTPWPSPSWMTCEREGFCWVWRDSSQLSRQATREILTESWGRAGHAWLGSYLFAPLPSFALAPSRQNGSHACGEPCGRACWVKLK